MFKHISACLDKVIAFRTKAWAWKAVLKTNLHYQKLFKDNGIAYRHLNSSQKMEVDNIWLRFCKWRGYIKYNKYTYVTHELSYSATGIFNPFIVPEDLWWPTLFRRVNIMEMSLAWADKNYFESLLPVAKYPKSIVRNVNGRLYNESYTLLDEEGANQLLHESGDLFVKPSLDSGSGKGVHLFTKEDKATIKDINCLFKRNYVVQKVFHQHKDFSVLNESSVNVIRLITVNVKGKTELLMAAIRIGNKGAINDYSPTSQGTGAIIVGIDETGVLKPVGYETCGREVKCCSNGYVFAGHKIPKFQEMVECVLSYHQRMPYFRMIGWDMVVDEEGIVTVMEYNLKWPGILYYQWCNGPLFGSDEAHVINMVNSLIS